MTTLRQELTDRLALAKHAKRRGLLMARRSHTELALAARRLLRRLNQSEQ